MRNRTEFTRFKDDSSIPKYVAKGRKRLIGALALLGKPLFHKELWHLLLLDRKKEKMCIHVITSSKSFLATLPGKNKSPA